jgi:hypothetical protein
MNSAKAQKSSLNLVDLCKEASIKAKPILDGAKTTAQDFGEGLFYGMFQAPVNGTTQLANHLFQQHWAPPKVVSPRHHPDHGATRVGEVTGALVDTVGIFQGAGLLGGATRISGVAAGAFNAALSSVPEKDGYWANKAAFVGVCAVGGANLPLGKACFDKAMRLISR